MPAETAPHERTLMAWPTRVDLWGPLLAEARRDYATVASVIGRGEPVLMIANPGDGAEAAAACGPSVDVLELPIDDSWMRDTGPIVTVCATGRRVAVDFRFNSWGEKFLPHAHDVAIATRVSDHLGLEAVAEELVLEGGSITVDGGGTLVTTEQCLLHPNRNPTRSRAEIEAVLASRLGVERIVWLPFGLVGDLDTDGHVDNVAAFIESGRIAAQTTADSTSPDFARLRENVRVLRGADLDVTELATLPYARVGGRTVTVPYLNWYVANEAVVVPITGHPDDGDVLARIGALYEREAIGVPGAVLAYGGGGVHCITQQVPA